MTVPRAAAVILAAMLAATAWFGLTHQPPLDCSPRKVDHLTDEQITELHRLGWEGKPNDHMEALYAPGCP